MVEKTLVLTIYELRLLMRDTVRLSVVCAIPLLVGLFLGPAGRGSSSFGLFLLSPVSLLVIAVHRTISDDVQNVLTPSALREVAWGLFALVVSSTQAVLYAGMIALLNPSSVPSAQTIAAALAISIIIACAAKRARCATR